jgi:hypothetical protein
VERLLFVASILPHAQVRQVAAVPASVFVCQPAGMIGRTYHFVTQYQYKRNANLFLSTGHGTCCVFLMISFGTCELDRIF